MVEILFGTCQLTDVGCTYRLIKREAYEKIRPYFKVHGDEFNMDMMLRILRSKIKFIEVPINYKKRVGVSSVTGKKYKAVIVGFKMIALIFLHRLKLM